MDLMLIGGIAILGYELNKSKTTIDRKQKTIKLDSAYETYPLISSHEIEKNKEKLQKRVTEHLNHPKTIGNHNLVPFFKSGKSQNTNDDVKDRRLKMFTGINNDEEFTHKKEIENFTNFQNKNEHIIKGSKSQPFDKNRYEASILQTNNLPFEQIRVGKGLGIDANIDADGGFHTQFRIKPNNVNSYRKNQFKNRMIIGKNHQDKRTLESAIGNFDKTIYQCQRPAMPTKSDITAQQSNQINDIQKETNRNNICRTNIYDVPSYKHIRTNTDHTRTNDSSKCSMVLNPYSNKGSFTTQTYLTHPTDRESETIITNRHNQNMHPISDTTIDPLKPTLRHHTMVNNWTGAASSVVQKPIDMVSYDAKSVKRTQFNENNCNYNGIISGNLKYNNDFKTVKNTKRNQIVKNELQNDIYIQGMKNVPKIGTQGLGTNYAPNVSRELTSYAYTPNMSRVNVLGDPCDITGNTQIKLDNNLQSVKLNSIKKSINNFQEANQIGCTNLDNEINVNRRLDFDITNIQLKNNPYNIDITKRTPT